MSWANDFTWVDEQTSLGPTNLNKINQAIRDLKGVIGDGGSFVAQIARDDFGVAFGDSGSFLHLRRHTTVPAPFSNVLADLYVQARGTRASGNFSYGFNAVMSDDASVVNKNISSAANNGSGLIRISCTGHGFSTNDWIAVYGVGGTTEANGAWQVTVIDANTFDLQGSSFSHAYTSGGVATNRPGLYGGLVTVIPTVTRDLLLTGTAVDADDVDGIGVLNGSANNSTATTAFIVNKNPSFTGDQWWSGFQIEANVKSGFVFLGNVSQYGIDFCGGSFAGSFTPPTFGLGAIRFPNNVKVFGRNAANSADSQMFLFNTLNETQFLSNTRFSATNTFDGGITLNNTLTALDGNNLAFGTTTGSKIGTGTNQKIGFFNATPVVQPNGTGNTHTVAAGSTTSVFTNTTFDGSTGSTAYTVGDIVRALKSLGLLAA